MVKKIVIDFDKDLKIKELKEDFNLFLFNSSLFNFDDLKVSNELFRRLQNVKLEICID